MVLLSNIYMSVVVTLALAYLCMTIGIVTGLLIKSHLNDFITLVVAIPLFILSVIYIIPKVLAYPF